MRILRTAILTVAGGLLIAVVLFTLTSPPDEHRFLPVNSVVTQTGHIDPWTGEITPMIWTHYDFGSGQVATVSVIPEDYKKFRVIPTPVGFVVGSVLTLMVITIVARRPRSTARVVPA